MSEEQACLVRARSDSENSANMGSFGSMTRAMTYTEDKLNTTEASGEPAAANPINSVISPPENRDINEGEIEICELRDYNDGNALDQFHEDAIRRAGCGFSQARVILACSLAIAGASLELSAIPFVLPSAEIELCVLPHERNWLLLISLMGCAFGSLGWGSLSVRLGRRRTLLSCLAVNAVFATIAAFMPTYGTFMMARFCSALGSGGAVPLSYTYSCEVSGRGGARAGAAGAVLAGGAGALLAAQLAASTLPPTGAATLAENREHFSAWHRYLLLCTLPILASLISLIWTPESPRYLLEVGREVDAMGVYQRIHRGNRLRFCGKANMPTNDETEYRLGELSVPGKSRPPALHHVRHSVKMFWQSFFQLFTSPYAGRTLIFVLILGSIFNIQYFLAGYIPFTVVAMERATYESATTFVHNLSFAHESYNDTVQNFVFENTTFTNCSLRDLLMFHVEFWNCSFYEVAMTNIKSSRTKFFGCLFVNSTIIDTDLEEKVEFDEWCVFNSTVIRGMKGGCARHADLTSKLSGLIREQTYIAYGTFIAVIFTLVPDALRPSIHPSLLMVFMAPLVYVIKTEISLYVMEALFRIIITVMLFSESLRIYQAYPANLRSTAFGFIMSIAFALAIAAWNTGAQHADGLGAMAWVCGASVLALAGSLFRLHGIL